MLHRLVRRSFQVAHLLEEQGAGLGPKAIDLDKRDRVGVADDGADGRRHVDVGDGRRGDQGENQEERELRAHRGFREGRGATVGSVGSQGIVSLPLHASLGFAAEVFGRAEIHFVSAVSR